MSDEAPFGLAPTAGLVTCYYSNVFEVHTAAGILYQCTVKGTLKKEGRDILVGDRVTLDSLDDANRMARIVAIAPRTTELSRPKVSNVDQALIVCSVQQPDLDLQQLDRYLSHVLLAGLRPLICLNKSDLVTDSQSQTIQAAMDIYEPMGFRVLLTSIFEPDSVDTLKAGLLGHTTVLTGPSGVGKSSLINVLKPEAQLKVSEVSAKQQRGRHTTRQAALFPLAESNTFVVDSPGFTYLTFDQTLPETLEKTFPEFAAFREQCRFHNCLHEASDLDAGCAVMAQLEETQDKWPRVARARWESYQQFLLEAKAYEQTLQSTSQKDDYGTKIKHTKGKDASLQLLKLKEKERQASRRRQRQQVSSWVSADVNALDEASLTEDS